MKFLLAQQTLEMPTWAENCWCVNKSWIVLHIWVAAVQNNGLCWHCLSELKVGISLWEILQQLSHLFSRKSWIEVIK